VLWLDEGLSKLRAKEQVPHCYGQEGLNKPLSALPV